MRKYLTDRLDPSQLVRLKKSIQWIRHVVDSYQTGSFDHVGFSCAIAVSKAEELKNYVSPFSPAHPLFQNLIQALGEISKDGSASARAEDSLNAIHAYFDLGHLSFTQRSYCNE